MKRPSPRSSEPQLLTLAQRRNRFSLGIGFVLGIATLIIVATAVSRSANEFIRTANDVSRINRMLSLMQQIDLTLTRAESERRGYLITSDPSFLTSYEGVSEEVTREFRLLRSLEPKDPEIISQIARIEHLAQLRIDELERVYIISHYLGTSAAMNVVSRQRGLTLMRDVRGAMAKLENYQRRILRKNDLANRQNRDEARIYLFTGLGFAVLTVTVSMGIVLRDSGRRMEAEARLASLLSLQNAILDSAAAAIFAFDAQGRITVFNRTAERLLGYRAEQVIGRMTPANFHLASELRPRATGFTTADENVAKLMADAAQSERFERRWTLVRKDGGHIPAIVSYTVLRTPTGEASGFVGVATDLSEIEAARRDLQAHVEQLEAAQSALAEQNERLAQASDELKESRDVALAATRLKSEFLANMSHEIRTPMNGVLGMAHLLMQSNLSDRQRSFVATMQQSAESLLTILNDILDLSKMEAGKMSLELLPFDLRDLMEDVTESLASIAHRKEIDITLRIPPDVPVATIGDATRLRQVLLNLASNALKFTSRGSVQLSVEPVEIEAAAVRYRFSVRDTGIGIPEEHLPHIFESFAQADGSTTRRFGGSGLGLSIVRQLTHLMEGNFGVESELGLGSHFWVELPLGRQPFEPENWPKALDGARILLVDPSDAHRHITEELLTFWGSDVTSLEAPELALKALEGATSEFDLAILNLNPSDRLAMGTTEAIRGLRPSLPLVLTTPIGYFPDSEWGANLFRAVLSIPVKTQSLYEAVQEVLSVGEVVAEPEPAPPTIDLSGLRILVVEDNAVNQLVAVEILSNLHCEAEIAEDGVAAVARILAGERYDVVLMDVQMPGMDGLEATRRIRALEEPRGERTPIVAMTANAMTGDREECLEAGMDAYMAKPLQARDLVEAILELVSPGLTTTQSLLDEEKLEAAVSGKASLKRKVVLKYLETSAKTMTEIARAAETDDHAALAAAAHHLKGSTLTIGSPVVAEHCSMIERAARSEHVLHEIVAILEADLAQLRRELSTVLARLETEP